MHYRLICALLACACAASAFAGTSGDGQEKQRYVVVPREYGLPAAASQPDCPVQFEKIAFLRGVDGGERVTFTLRNTGTKPVSSVTYGFAASHGGGWVAGWPMRVTNEVVMPGQAVPLSESEGHVGVVPLTDELRNKLKLRGPMQAVAVFMVVKVKFSDGSVYDDEPVFKSLQAYFDEIADKSSK